MTIYVSLDFLRISELMLRTCIFKCIFYHLTGILYPTGNIHKKKVLLFVTDAAPYMVKSANHLKAFYNEMIHLTCLAHAAHRVCEFIREEFAIVNKLVSSVKKVNV